MHTRISFDIHASISISVLLVLLPILASPGSITMSVHIRESVKVLVFIVLSMLEFVLVLFVVLVL